MDKNRLYLLQWIKDSLTICKINLLVNLFLLSLILKPAASACKGNAGPVVILLDSAIFGQKIAITSSKSSQHLVFQTWHDFILIKAYYYGYYTMGPQTIITTQKMTNVLTTLRIK